MKEYICEHCQKRHRETLEHCPKTGRIFRPERFFPLNRKICGKFKLIDVIASGGMGAVFRAQHLLLKREIALKLLLPQMANDDDYLERMIREARAASAAKHPNIVEIFDVGWTENKSLYIAMELIDGQTLTQYLKDRRLEIEEALKLATQILEVLVAIHKHHIIHRDLKPDNIMVLSGTNSIKLLDFGVSKVIGENQINLTQTGCLIGSPRYMSPEQAKGESVDYRADIYSAGCLFYLLLTQQTPLNAKDLPSMIAKLLSQPIKPPSSINSKIDAKLDAIVLKALEKNPDQRFKNAEEFLTALESYLNPAKANRLDSTMALNDSDLIAVDGEACEKSKNQEYLNAFDAIDVEEPETNLIDNARSFSSRGRSMEKRKDEIYKNKDGHELVLIREKDTNDPLELDHEDAWRSDLGEESQKNDPEIVHDEYQHIAKRFSFGRYFLGVFILILGFAAWIGVDHFARVELSVDVDPKGAKVYFDETLSESGSLRVWRKSKLYRVRVKAKHYRTKEFNLRSDKNKRIKVALQPL